MLTLIKGARKIEPVSRSEWRSPYYKLTEEQFDEAFNKGAFARIHQKNLDKLRNAVESEYETAKRRFDIKYLNSQSDDRKRFCEKALSAFESYLKSSNDTDVFHIILYFVDKLFDEIEVTVNDDEKCVLNANIKNESEETKVYLMLMLINNFEIAYKLPHNTPERALKEILFHS